MNENEKLTKAVESDELFKKNPRVKRNFFFPVIITLFIGMIFLIIFLLFNRTGSISGKVVDLSDQTVTINHVSIYLDGQEAGENNDITGGFTLYKVKPGNHTIVFRRPGFNNYTETVNVKAGKSIRIIAKLSIPKAEKVSKGLNLVVLGNNISVINLKENKELGKIGIGSGSNSVVTVVEKNRIYVSNTDQDSISVIDFKNMTELKKIQLQNNSKPTDLVLSPQRDKLYINNSSLRTISVIDLINDELIKPDIFPSGLSFINRIIPNKNGGIILLAVNQIGIITAGTNNVGSIYPVSGNSPEKAISSQNGVYLVSGDEIINFDLNSGNESKFSLPSQPGAIALNPSGSILYSASSDSISIFSASGGSPLKTDIPTGESGIVKLFVSPSGDKLYILSSGSNIISVFDCNKQEMLKEKIYTDSVPKSLDFIEGY